METKKVEAKFIKVYESMLTPRYAIIILTVLASAIRLLPTRFRYLLGYDPYFHLAYIQYALKKGEWMNFFPYASGPWGIQLHDFHPLGLWMTVAYVYKFFSIFGVSLYNAFRITPVIFGVFTVIFIYIAMLRLYGKREAFLSSFFLAVLFGHIFRSMAGYYRGDNYMIFWYSVGLSGIALALSKDNEKWGHKRLAFYLVPALASGFSAIFWTAYYPIFVFFLGNSIFIAVAAFLLDEKDTFIDALALVMATVFGAFLANTFGGYFGYGMASMSKELGQALANEFGLQFGLIKDAFIVIYLKYAVPVSIVIILALFILSRGIKEKKLKAIIIAIGIIVAFWIGIKYYGKIDSILLKLFPEAAIVETQRTTFNDLWRAYGVAVFIVPAFFLTFIHKKTTTRDFLLLGFIVIAVPLILLWTRFLFIGSLAVAIMAGIGIVKLYELAVHKVETKKFGAAILTGILLLIPTGTAAQGVQHTISVKPLVNDMWENALTQLWAKTNINDIILTWWDQGSWVIYYSKRAPVAQLAPDTFVAAYYLGLRSTEGLMERGVDYIIVSYDTILKFGAIIKTANASPSEYAMIPMPLISSTGGMLLFSAGPYSVMAIPREDSWHVEVNAGGAILVPRKVFIEKGISVKEIPITNSPNSNAYVYINLNYGYAVLMNEKAFETPLARLMFTNDHQNFTEIYSDGGYIKIFQFEHPNVAVTSENGSVVLKFTNTTGTRIEIYGYLDNGTLVFEKGYGIKGADEFILPTKINGSVVVRYTYIQEKTVLDRGVFRIEDVTHNG